MILSWTDKLTAMSISAMQSITKDGVEPLYLQIKNNIKSQINQQVWKSGQKLPSENEWVKNLSVSRMTVHRALRELTQEGLLTRVHGLGTFVAKPTRHASLITLQDIADEVKASGSTYRCRVITHKLIKASKEMADAMEISNGAALFQFRAVHFQDELPIQYEDRLVNPVIAPEFIHQDFSENTTTQYLVSLGKPDEMEHIVQAVIANTTTAKLLMLDQNQPCLKLSRRTWFNHSVVTRVNLFYPGDRYDLAERYQTEQYQSIHQAN